MDGERILIEFKFMFFGSKISDANEEGRKQHVFHLVRRLNFQFDLMFS